MAFTLKEIVPWGRSFFEYQKMFALTESDLKEKILGCADGPASFNAGLTAKGGEIVSIDPLYRFSQEGIRERIDQVFGTVLEETRKNAHEFIWTSISSVDHLGEIRREAMEAFLEDYPRGVEEGRYLDNSLPELPFNSGEFGLAVCSHYLFLYSPHLSLDFHLQSIRELCRVARKVRIFPLLELGAIPSRHLESVIDCLTREEYRVAVEAVPYEFQRGGNRMMCIEGP